MLPTGALWWEADASQQLLITLVRAKGIESPIDIYVMERDILLLCFLQPGKGLIILAESDIN